MTDYQQQHTELVADLQALIDKHGPGMAAPGYTIPDEEILGILVSKWCDWSVDSVVEVAKAAAEDSNMREVVEYLDALPTWGQ